MANIKSAKKRIKVIETKTLKNKMIKSKAKTLTKNVLAAVAAGNKEEAVAAFKEAAAHLDRSAAKGVYHKNTVARKIANLQKAVNSLN